MLRPTLLFLAVSLVACGGSSEAPQDSSANATTAATEPANFSKVTDGIYRGGHPDEAQIRYLKSIGIKTIVDLEVDDMIEAMPGEIATEEAEAFLARIKLERFPMSAFEPAVSGEFDARVDQIMATLRDDSKKPIYVHCKHGQDRTGLVVGLERVLVEHWAPQDAYDEMLKIGFHPAFIGLDAYFEWKTGWTPPTGNGT